MNKDLLARVVPFAAFMAFIGVEEGLRYLRDAALLEFTDEQLLYLYPLKTAVVGLILIFLARTYQEIRLADFTRLGHTTLSIAAGLLIFILWINMDWGFATFGDPKGFNPNEIAGGDLRIFIIGARLVGAVILVPIMEELFWRSFLLRYVIDGNFTAVKIGQFTWSSFLIITVLFGLEHNYFLAGMMAGAIFNLLLYQTRSLAQCILCHAVANLALGLYVLQTGQWRFW